MGCGIGCHGSIRKGQGETFLKGRKTDDRFEKKI